MGVINKVLGMISPSHQSFKNWCLTYDDIISSRHISAKTLRNKRGCVAHLVKSMGHHSMKSIRPIHVAACCKAIWESGRQNQSQRVLLEAVDIFNEAILAGVIDSNPATFIKRLPAPVKRKRLSFAEFETMLSASIGWQRCLLLLAITTGQRRADLHKMRFDDVKDGHVYIEQQKTGARIAIPVDLRLDVLSMSISDVIVECMKYAPIGDYMLRKNNGDQFGIQSLSYSFYRLYFRTHGRSIDIETPTLHECRSLSERLYRVQGIDTKTLLGHKRQQMTDMYNDERGLNKDDYKLLRI
jgi:enterobacteria phage integrase